MTRPECLYWWGERDRQRWIVVRDDEHGIAREVRDATSDDMRTLPVKGGTPPPPAAAGFGPPYSENDYKPITEEVDDNG